MSEPVDSPSVRPLDRRAFLRRLVPAGGVLVAGCVTPPSSAGPAFEVHEIDDGPVLTAGLRDETVQEFYATLVTDEAGASAFDTDALVREADRSFVCRPTSPTSTSAWFRSRG